MNVLVNIRNNEIISVQITGYIDGNLSKAEKMLNYVRRNVRVLSRYHKTCVQLDDSTVGFFNFLTRDSNARVLTFDDPEFKIKFNELPIYEHKSYDTVSDIINTYSRL